MVYTKRSVIGPQQVLFTLSAMKDNSVGLCPSRVDSGSVLVGGDWKQGIFPDTNEYHFY